MFTSTSLDLAAKIIAACTAKGFHLTSAESCTGGLIIACLTEIAGSSAVVDRGFVVYSNQAKRDLLGVPARLIDRHGAVSEEVACAMATGALKRAGVEIAIAVTGVAGPGGGTAVKPVGLVHLALAVGNRIDAVRAVFDGDRRAVREATLNRGLQMIEKALS